MRWEMKNRQKLYRDWDLCSGPRELGQMRSERSPQNLESMEGLDPALQSLPLAGAASEPSCLAVVQGYAEGGECQ